MIFIIFARQGTRALVEGQRWGVVLTPFYPHFRAPLLGNRASIIQRRVNRTSPWLVTFSFQAREGSWQKPTEGSREKLWTGQNRHSWGCPDDIPRAGSVWGPCGGLLFRTIER